MYKYMKLKICTFEPGSWRFIGNCDPGETSHTKGTELPASILFQGNYQPVPDTFSPAYRSMSQQLFQKDPELRPTAEQLLTETIPKIIEQLANHVNHTRNYDTLSSITSSNER